MGYGTPAPFSSGPLPRTAASADPLVLNTQERELGALLESAPGQRAHGLAHSPVLARVARERAEDMARRGYFSHTTPEGLGPNTLVERAGYRLPAHYDRRPAGNNIESLGTGYATAASVWRRWMGSAQHRRHLLGNDPVFRLQTEYGIGYAIGRGGQYWVVLIAQPASPETAPAAR